MFQPSQVKEMNSPEFSQGLEPQQDLVVNSSFVH